MLSLIFVSLIALSYSLSALAQEDSYDNSSIKIKSHDSFKKVSQNGELVTNKQEDKNKDIQRLKLSNVLIDYNKYNPYGLDNQSKPNLKQKINATNADYHHLILLGGEVFVDKLYNWFLKNEMLVHSPYQDRKSSKIYNYIYKQIAFRENRDDFLPDISTAAYNASYEFFNYVLLYKELNKQERLQFRKYFAQLLKSNF